MRSPFAVSFFGTAFGQATEGINILAIDGRSPQPETVDSPDPYLLLRPLYLYTSADVLNQQNGLRNFLIFYLTNVNNYIDDVGYFPVGIDDFPAQIEALNNALP